jgi:hypothetical protein
MSRTRTHGVVKVHPERLRTFLATPAESKKRPPRVHGQPIAPGFEPDHGYDLRDFGGKTIQNLSYVNVYLGVDRWPPTDMANIDQALAAAMSDVELNHVLRQYFGGRAVSTRFLGSKRSDAPVPATFDRDSVSATLDRFHTAGQLAGLDFSSTVVNLLLPPGIILDTRAASGVGGEKKLEAEDKDSSLEGLGGYHGSHRTTDGTVIYFAAAVYSQRTGHKVNGIPVWPDPWKNVVATLYHELHEARTDADVEQVNATGNERLLGWYSEKGGEVGDIPISLAGDHLHLVFVEETLRNGEIVPVQLMWSNAAGGPGVPF